MVLGWIWRIILFLIVLRLVLRLLAGVFEGMREPGRNRSAKGRADAVALVKDPVCGTYVLPGKALSTTARSATYYFCSEACRRAFASRQTSRSA